VAYPLNPVDSSSSGLPISVPLDTTDETAWAALTNQGSLTGTGSDGDATLLASLPPEPGVENETTRTNQITVAQAQQTLPAAPAANQLPPQQDTDNSWTHIIGEALKSVPAGTAPIIGTRINALPPQFIESLPENIRQQIQKLVPANASVALAIILPPDTLQRLQKGGPSDVLLNSTLWVGFVPPSGPMGVPQVFGSAAAYVLTLKMNGNPLETGKSPTVDFRAGYAFLNDIQPQNILRGQSPIVPDRVSPDTWLFLNAGVSGDFSNIQQLPQIIQEGQDQLTRSLTVTRDQSGHPTGLDFSARGGGVITGGALVRVPASETLAHRAGQSLMGWGRSIAALPSPVTTPVGGLIAAAGIVLNQSTGLYVGPGASLAKLSFDTKGEITFGTPGYTVSTNFQDAPAIGAGIGANITRPFSPNLADQLDRTQPSRTTLPQILNTPTNTSEGKPVPNGTRLQLYWDHYVRSNPNLDRTSVASSLVQSYNAPGVAQTQKRNIEYLYYQPDLQANRLLLSTVFRDGKSDRVLIPPSGLTSQNLSQAISQRRSALGETEFRSRIQELARGLRSAGLNNNFGIRELASELNRTRSAQPRPNSTVP
jgi:hypothetical protein